jgi:serine acetyltransferase
MGFGQLVTPGVTLRKGSVIMAGSVVTKSTEEYRTYSGTPAKDVSDKLPAWRVMGLNDKVELMKKFINEFVTQHEKYKQDIHLLDSNATNFTDEMARIVAKSECQIIIVNTINLFNYNSHHSVFDLSTKKYLKKLSQIEIDFMKFNLGYRARFIPFN